MKVSVIIPVYNVQDYILECLNSIIYQDFKDFEVIIVNDGSQDNSINNIKSIIDNHSNIHLINKPNGGLSSARNEGLRYATGEYVIFIDSDDYIQKDFISSLYSEAKKYNLDIACGGYTSIYSDNSIYPRIRNRQIFKNKATSGKEILLNQLKNNDYCVEVWDDLYKREFLLDNNIFFIEGIVHEDEEFTSRALLVAQRVKAIETYGYMYRQRENSIMNTKCTIKNIDSIYYIINRFRKMFDLSQNDTEKICLSYLILYMHNLYIQKILMCDEKNKYKLLKKIDVVKISKGLDKSHLTFKQRLKYDIPYILLINFIKHDLIQREHYRKKISKIKF